MSSKASDSGIGLGGVLFVVFLVMKLTDNIVHSECCVEVDCMLCFTKSE